MRRNDRHFVHAAAVIAAIGCPVHATRAQTDERFEAVAEPADRPEQLVGEGVLVYEGLLVYLETPVDGEVDMVVTAWDRPMGGTALDGPTLYEGVPVEGGWFRVELEPTLLERGRGFAWLEVAVRWPSGLGEFEMLDGRQRLDFASVSFVPRKEGGEGVKGDEAEGSGAGTPARASAGVPVATGRRLADSDAPAVRDASPAGRGASGFGRVGSGDFGAGDGGDDGSGGGGSRSCDWVVSGSRIYYTCGNVGIGTTNPLHPLHVVSAGQHAIFAANTRAASGFAYGVWGESASPDGRGVLGFATSKTGATAGVFGRSDSTGGRGVFGVATAGSGFAYGVWGESASTTGRGVLGFATAKTGANAGLYGRSDSTTGYGVYGLATATQGVNYGVYSETRSQDGFAGYFKGGRNYFEGSVGVGVMPASEESIKLRVHSSGGITLYSRNNFSDGHAIRGMHTGDADGTGVYGESWGQNGMGVVGWATHASSENWGVVGKSTSTTGRGVFGHATSSSGSTRGVIGQSDSNGGIGVYGLVLTGSGVTSGVFGRSMSTSGIGVSGDAPASTGLTYGVYGSSMSTSGRGVYGTANASSGTTYGVLGESSSSGGRGVAGIASASSGTTYGVYGQSNSNGGYGVFGYGTASGGALCSGVWGVTESLNASSRGVLGLASSPAVAVYASGNSVTTGTKSFEIDHPLDPANKYLRHYCTEGHEPLNAYSGNAVLDEAGQAWVDLPDYFEAINRDFRYQLTTIGGWAPVYVALKIENNRFMIAGGQPGLEVSWRVEAVRNDAYVRANGAPVEIDKPEEVRGKYLHPELFGQPRAMGIYHNPMPTPAEVVAVDP